MTSMELVDISVSGNIRTIRMLLQENICDNVSGDAFEKLYTNVLFLLISRVQSENVTL